ncbi:hypothetical protein LUZ60_015843 [Juncus effusus]|nr:hypothetical protein LUZ60_015843 [Juncus effusus]
MASRLPSLLSFSLTFFLFMPTILSCQLCNSSNPIPKSSPPCTSPAPVPKDDTIKSLCSRTDDYKLCVTTIQCQLPIHEPLDPAMVFRLAMRAVRSNSKAAKSLAVELLRDPKNKPAINALKDCKELYGNMVANLDSADEAVEVHDKGTVSSMLSAVRTDIGTCKEGFDEIRLPDLMAKCDDLLVKLASICLAIAQAASLM